jgi:hypothetical protein
MLMLPMRPCTSKGRRSSPHHGVDRNGEQRARSSSCLHGPTSLPRAVPCLARKNGLARDTQRDGLWFRILLRTSLFERNRGLTPLTHQPMIASQPKASMSVLSKPIAFVVSYVMAFRSEAPPLTKQNSKRMRGAFLAPFSFQI